jgi:26S proteasome regulatory subunit N5
MAENKKQEKDFTKEVDALLPETDAVIKVRGHQSGRFDFLRL